MHKRISPHGDYNYIADYVVDNEYTANSVHYEIEKIVRKAIKEAGCTMPEDLKASNKSLKE